MHYKKFWEEFYMDNMYVRRDNSQFEVNLDKDLNYSYSIEEIEKFSEKLKIPCEQVAILAAIIQRAAEDLKLEEPEWLQTDYFNVSSFDLEQAMDSYKGLVINRNVDMEIVLDRLAAEAPENIVCVKNLERVICD